MFDFYLIFHFLPIWHAKCRGFGIKEFSMNAFDDLDIGPTNVAIPPLTLTSDNEAVQTKPLVLQVD